MRSIIKGLKLGFSAGAFTVYFLVLLAGCNQGTTQVPYSDPALVAKVDALTKALAAATHDSTQKFASLTIIGKSGLVSMDAGGLVFNFGPCPDMGVLVGRGTQINNPTGDPLSANIEAFHQCTGYDYNTVLGSGTIGTAPRLFWDGPNCTGNMLEWEAGGQGFNSQTLQDGVVFLSPVDGTPLMVKSGQTAQMIMMQSVWVLSNPGCQSDIEPQLMYFVTPNDVNVTGVPIALPKVPQLSSP